MYDHDRKVRRSTDCNTIDPLMDLVIMCGHWLLLIIGIGGSLWLVWGIAVG